jgi:hypothetical protein
MERHAAVVGSGHARPHPDQRRPGSCISGVKLSWMVSPLGVEPRTSRLRVPFRPVLALNTCSFRSENMRITPFGIGHDPRAWGSTWGSSSDPPVGAFQRSGSTMPGGRRASLTVTAPRGPASSPCHFRLRLTNGQRGVRGRSANFVELLASRSGQPSQREMPVRRGPSG